MPLPEGESPEHYSTVKRIDDLIFDAVKNVAGRRGLPPRVGVLVYDEQTQERFFGGVEIQTFENGVFILDRAELLAVPSNLTLAEAVDQLVVHNPDLSLVCDSRIAEELSNEAILFEESHFRLIRTKSGSVEIYTTYPARKAEPHELSGGAEGGLVYLDREPKNN